ncbi:CPCC family cysteine-rich protein [Hyalangium sp.]|uniref:CPCC family cysteine-rich protein n=1 Tax=Hyalangium sp. TaxID=2028555 RepID=UPI002D474982|nr:CPCC family cysteine-rich protein [Hyalangium sp.]HYH98762.1 CPCC family cysteine-rich protein [Hyalangium sp.]
MPSKHLCSCCRLPTLAERGESEVCDVCWWEDNAQDDADAEVVRGGPNGDYSLAEARRNFLEHGSMYRAGDRIHRWAGRPPSPEERPLLDKVLAAGERFRAAVTPDQEEMAIATIEGWASKLNRARQRAR